MFFRYSEAKEAEPVPGVKRKMIANGERIQIVEFFLPKGQSFPLHSHPIEQTGYIAEGKLYVKIGEEEAVLEKGDGYFVPMDVEHSTRAVEDCVNIDVFSPPRPEYKDR